MNKTPACQKCRRAQYFVCSNINCTCRKAVPKGKLYQIESYGQDLLSCPYCGYTASFDYWEERDIQSLLRYKGVKSFSELDEKRRTANLAGMTEHHFGHRTKK